MAHFEKEALEKLANMPVYTLIFGEVPKEALEALPFIPMVEEVQLEWPEDINLCKAEWHLAFMVSTVVIGYFPPQALEALIQLIQKDDADGWVGSPVIVDGQFVRWAWFVQAGLPVCLKELARTEEELPIISSEIRYAAPYPDKTFYTYYCRPCRKRHVFQASGRESSPEWTGWLSGEEEEADY